MNKYDENYFNNLAANGVISGDEIRLFVGRILQYGYRGTISTSWRSQNEAAANSIAQAYATQLLIWETVIGERDANFNHVAASGCNNVKDVINAKHPLRNKISVITTVWCRVYRTMRPYRAFVINHPVRQRQ